METDSSKVLPSDWQRLPSKSYPEKVYYFNIRTGLSTWEVPKDLQADSLDSCSTSQNKTFLINTEKKETFGNVSTGKDLNSSKTFSSDEKYFLIRSPIEFAPDDSSESSTSDVHSVNSVDSTSQGSSTKTRKWHSKKVKKSLLKNMSSESSQNRMTKKIKITRPSFASPDNSDTSKETETNERIRDFHDDNTVVISSVKTDEKKKQINKSVPSSTSLKLPIHNLSPPIKPALKLITSKDGPLKRVQFSKKEIFHEISSPQNPMPKQTLSQSQFPGPTQHQVFLQNEDEGSPMEVDEIIDEEKMLIDIQEVRENLKKEPQMVVGELTSLNHNFPSKMPNSRSQILCLVIDTNIFISELNFLKKLPRDIKDLNCNFMFIVPWVVLQELDALKNPYLCSNVAQAVSKKARLAVSYLHEELSSAESHFQGQSIMEACASDSHPENNDDRILLCCVHYSRKENHAVILFSNDKNLCNKAIVSNITACMKHNIMQSISCKLNKFNSTKKVSEKKNISGEVNDLKKVKLIQEKSQVKMQQEKSVQQAKSPLLNQPKCTTIKEINHPVVKHQTPNASNSHSVRITSEKSDCVSNGKSHSFHEIAMVRDKMENVIKFVFSAIIEEEMERAYGNIWLKVVYHKPPWTLLQLMDCIKHHWRAVFGFFLPKRSLATLEDLTALLKDVVGVSHCSIKALNKIILGAIDVLMTFQLHSEYQGIIHKALRELSFLQHQCTDLERFFNDSPISRIKESSLLHTEKEVSDSPRSPIQRNYSSIVEYERKINSKRLHDDESDSVYEPQKKICAGDQKNSNHKYSSPLNSSRNISDSSSSNTSQTMRGVNKIIQAENLNNPITQSYLDQQISVEVPKDYSTNVLNVLSSIWESLNHYCGVICDSIGVQHSLQYAKLNQLPPKEETYTFLPRIFPSVHSIFKALRSVLAWESTSDHFVDSCYSLYNALVNFYPSIDSQDEENIENLFTPEMLIAFCKDKNFRIGLTNGLWQLEGYRSLLQCCISSINNQVI